MGFESEREVGLNAVMKASRACARMSETIDETKAFYKTDGSPVTLADFFVQFLVNSELSAAFPEIPIVAEESSLFFETDGGRELLSRLKTLLPQKTAEEIARTIDGKNHKAGSYEKFWTLDPIDGTRGFLAKRQYAIALALIENGEVVLGILGCPRLPPSENHKPGDKKGDVFFAERGRGAFQIKLWEDRKTRISVSGTKKASDAVMCESAEASDASYESSRKIARDLNISAKPVRMDSQCKYAVLARGDTSIYLRLPPKKNYKENIWDHAAGYILVKEAGGNVTDYLGNPLDFSSGEKLRNNTGILATNGIIHEEVTCAVKRTFLL